MLDVEGEGIAVLTLARGAYLIMRSDILASYPQEYLLQFSRTARDLEDQHRVRYTEFTPRKRRALRELSQHGYKISAGLEFGFQNIADPEVTLAQVQQGLSTMEGSLSQEVLAEREER
jgi:hypothetical protein